jgi:mediator of RNA polymerase II transcription subunit 22
MSFALIYVGHTTFHPLLGPKAVIASKEARECQRREVTAMAEEYRQRLDNNVEKLVENFKGMIKTAKIKDKSNTTREGFQSAIYATTLVQASESLLKLVSEMKLSLALGDFEGMNQTVDATMEDLYKRCDDVDANVAHLSSDISSALFELESHYYQSKWRLPPVDAAEPDARS